MTDLPTFQFVVPYLFTGFQLIDDVELSALNDCRRALTAWTCQRQPRSTALDPARAERRRHQLALRRAGRGVTGRVIMPGNPSDFVLDLKVETEFLDGCVRHMRYTQGSPSTESRIRVEEIWDIESTLGRGSYGIVRLERRRQTSTPSLESPHQVRAVKEISKTVSGGNRWDYMKELETIAKFSHLRYDPYFVRTYGWFENADSVFITMEFFPLGDLQHFMVTWPPFPEHATRQIVRQLIEGVDFMHESGFAHRDLKPGNILVKSHSPGWLVKIADFGISKRAQEGGTDLRTMHIGTFGYMAPEVLGFFSDNDPAVAYSVSIDIWAIGVICIELLLKRHPFSNVSDLVSYVHGTKQLDLVGVTGTNLSNTCRDFVSALLAPNPATRPTAGAAGKHPWIAAGIPSADTEESLFVEDDLQEVHLRARDAATPASLPSLAWSNLQLTDSLPATQRTSTLLSTDQEPHFDLSVLIPTFRRLSLDTTRYFILRSTNEVDVETSVAHGVWTSSPRVNKILNKGFTRADGQVVLFFSVIGSRKFCGVALMTSPMDWVNTDEHWLEDSWQGRFTLNWLCLTELSFDKVKHIPVSQKTPGFRAISCYDGTEISTTSAFELLQAFSAEERKQLQGEVGQLDVGGQGNSMLYSPFTGHGLSADEGFEDFVG